MLSLSQPLTVRQLFFRHAAHWAGIQAQGAKWSLHNPRGKGQWSATPLKHTQIYEHRWAPPKGTEGAGRSSHQDTFNNLPAALVNQGGPDWQEVGKCWQDAHLQERPEGDLGKNLGNQSPVSLTLVLGKIMEQIILNPSYGTEGSTKKSCPASRELWKVLLSWLDLPLWQDAPVSGWEKGCRCVCLDFNKTSDTILCIILLEELAAHGLGEYTVHGIENSLDVWAQRVVVNGGEFSWWLVTRGAAQGSVLGSVLFKIFTNELNNRIECILSQFADNTKFGCECQCPGGQEGSAERCGQAGSVVQKQLREAQQGKMPGAAFLSQPHAVLQTWLTVGLDDIKGIFNIMILWF